jgi:uncharacterized protein YndB with AHSA1/START domain
MADSRFVYVTYIRTTPAKLWRALLEPEFQRRYWFGASHKSDWKKGSAWSIVFADGRVADTGEIIEIEPERRLVLRWRNEFMPELKAEGFSRMTCDLEPAGASVKLTIVHEMERQDSKFIHAVSGGWPKILASLKSLLETGEPLPELASTSSKSG